MLGVSAPSKDTTLLARTLARGLAVARSLRDHNALSAAAAMAFYFFLSLIPLLVLAGSVLGLLVRKRGVDPLMAPFLDAIPKEAAIVVRRELEGLGGSVSTPLAPLGVIGFLFVASGGTHHMMDVFEVVVGAQRRAWWKQRALSVAWLAAMVTALSLVVAALVAFDAQVHPRVAAAPAHSTTPSAQPPIEEPPVAPHAGAARGGKSPHPPPAARPAAAPPEMPVEAPRHARGGVHRSAWEQVVAVILVLAVVLAGLAGLYRYGIEHVEKGGRRAWPGAVLAVVSWFLVSWLFEIYAQTLGSYAAFYGSVAAVAIIMVWLFLTSLTLLMGAELNAVLERETAPRGSPRSAHPPVA